MGSAPSTRRIALSDGSGNTVTVVRDNAGTHWTTNNPHFPGGQSGGDIFDEIVKGFEDKGFKEGADPVGTLGNSVGPAPDPGQSDPRGNDHPSPDPGEGPSGEGLSDGQSGGGAAGGQQAGGSAPGGTGSGGDDEESGGMGPISGPRPIKKPD
jgi:hypothetical protein